jgi:sugar phosphate isomerase/epimerase
MNATDRREFLRQSMLWGTAAVAAGPIGALPSLAGVGKRASMKLGLCTYQWGQDCDLPTLLANCEKAGVLGIELRTEHKHSVEPSLGPQKRKEVKRRFAASPVTFVGLGTNQAFDSPDPRQVERSIEGARAFVRLSHDCGGSGVKVKPNDFHPNVSHEKTIQQIGKSLNVLGRFAADFGQQIRLEVHGSCCDPPTIQKIMDVADDPNVAVCWNSMPQDLQGEGLEHNFNLLKNRLGATTHVHALGDTKYPYRRLFELLTAANYDGWMLLECYGAPKDRVAAMIEQRRLFERLLAAAGGVSKNG